MGGSSFSSVIAYAIPIILLQYFDMGWRDIFRYAPILMLLGAIVMYFVVRERPEDFGLVDPESEPVADSAASKNDHSTSLSRYKAVLTNRYFYIVGLAVGFYNAARYGLLVWIPVHFCGPEWKTGTGGIDPVWLTLALPLGMAFGVLSNAWLSDVIFKSKRYLVILSYMALAAIVAVVMMYIPHDGGLGLTFIRLSGFFVYGPASSFWALCPDIFGRRFSGTATGCINFVSYLFAGICEPLIGYLMDLSGTTMIIFPMVAGLCTASALVALTIRR